MGGEAYVRTQALKAMELSKNRAGEIRKLLIERFSLDPKRLDIVGRGWEEPAGPEFGFESPSRSAVVHGRMTTIGRAASGTLEESARLGSGGS